ncbi:Uncharacterised protein [Vibrio cholerae]|nr:Uncharacterised protein [Vibrio cholerae]
MSTRSSSGKRATIGIKVVPSRYTPMVLPENDMAKNSSTSALVIP